MPLLMPPDQLTPHQLHERRERVFLVLAGVFLGTLAMLNILGISRFIVFGSLAEVDGSWAFLSGQAVSPWIFAVAVGVLPYPVTFLCTDLISELYGRRRANFVVLVGLGLNVWVMFVLWIAGLLPGFEATDPATGALTTDEAGRLPAFFEIRQLAFAAVTASMIAYLIAQLVDVQLFHFWKRLTQGRHLWLRNNGSTLASQFVDTLAVVLISWQLGAFNVQLQEGSAFHFLLTLIVTGYALKFLIALADTGPIYLGVHYLSRFLAIDPRAEHTGSDDPPAGLTRGSPSHPELAMPARPAGTRR
ncbi:MAG: queuosine precursor transporter [Phycisphaeraceae bacterium]